MIKINYQLQPGQLTAKLRRMWELSAAKIRGIESTYDTSKGAPVFTVEGRYTSRGWTEWTQGFQFGSAILQYDATDETYFLDEGRTKTLQVMAPHVTHVGVHDHGFNNVSTYGNLLRLMNEGRTPANEWERHFYELALKCSGAVQARRWTTIKGGGGFIYSFNGPHSLFADTIRSLRAVAMGYRLGQVLMGENDRSINLLDRLVEHARSTAKYSVYYGKGRDSYDVRGRVAHESIFNINDGNYRCPNSQQGYSPFTTWTRGLAWIMCGYPEQLEFLETLHDDELTPWGGREEVEGFMLEAARASCDFYIENTPTDGVPYWDTGAPGLARMGDYLNRPADPFNDHEPVDSSAAAIAAQGLLRLGHYLQSKGDADAARYTQAGLTVLNTLLDEPYLSTDTAHQGLLLHSVYHRPNGWDHVPAGRKVPCGESSMWGDYHLREVGLYVQRLAESKPYLTFFGK
ncbi:MAG TPA: glycosyl hydrolase [Phycisphaerae bacterium]|nr:glycosyl hydrolase [Phycisphaerae bacterium]HOJ73057.1 glycosyl hydrolase [Phycisphaerae bacterium]HOM52673.1 glycosyl hydrolase [Phycisphaerae bacterium]HOQ85072.1 glycosyl hydrolase [Phycisphaerae bacterium]HPP25505.1 glycosyl hydrolase [Phycisphaerae bacterium]